MQFRVERQPLADAVAWAARTLSSRPALPVLAGMVVEASGEGELMFSAFDYEVSAQATIAADDGVAISEPGRVLVSGRLLAEIVRSLPPHPVEVALKGNEVVVSCGSAEFGLLPMPVEDYPTLPEPPAQAGTVPGDVFAAAVAQVTPAAGRDETLPMLTGVRIDLEGATMRLACTDRYRIATRELSWSPTRDGFAGGVVVPARTLADTAKSIRSGAEVRLDLAGVDDTLIGISGGGRSLTARLLDDQFIDYRSRFTGNWSTTARVRTAPLIEAIKRVALVTERNTPVRLAFTRGEVRIRAASGDTARANESVPASLEGEDVDIAFSPQYLLDGLNGVDTGLVRFQCTGPTKAALLTAVPESEDGDDSDPGGDTGFRYLAMPVRLAS